MDTKELELREGPAETTLLVRNLSKNFGATRALRNVNLKIKPGEIMGLLGQNGCGKSTLIKILAGYHAPEPGGELWMNGKSVKLPIHPGEFAQHGLSFVHQDLGLIADLSVLDNWMLGNLASRNKSLKIDWKKERQEARKAFAEYDIAIHTEDRVRNLGSVEKAMLAIIRAVAKLKENKAVREKNRGLLVLDEPTVFLPREEVNQLFALVRKITREGISVLFVSHDIDEVVELTDSFIVLRDGLTVGGGKTAAFTKEQIIGLILGTNLNKYSVCDGEKGGGDSFAGSEGMVKAAAIKGLTVKDLSFEIRKGEILGVTGLMGSGFGELPYMLCGAGDYQRGALWLDGRKIELKTLTPAKAIDCGVALIPADRGEAGGVGSLTVEENINMQALDQFRPWMLQLKRLRQRAKEKVKRYAIKPENPQLGFAQLSGGNQQKVILAKWVRESVKLLILHEPTQGVDIGARQQIYEHIHNVAKSGNAVLCASSDYEELAQICSRVLILRQGRCIGELAGDGLSKSRIVACCYQNYEEAPESFDDGILPEKSKDW